MALTLDGDSGNGNGTMYGQQPSANVPGFVDYHPPDIEVLDSLPQALIRVLSGRSLEGFVSPWAYPRTELGLDGYLGAHGIRHFTALELVRPAYRQWAEELYGSLLPRSIDGAVMLLPGRQCWPRYVVLCLLLERIRAFGDEPVKVKHVWRPGEYNARSKGSADSDHLEPGCAADIDFCSGRAYQRAMQDIDGLYAADVLYLSIARRKSRGMHLGIAAPRTLAKGAQRRWGYDERGRPVRAWG